MKKKMIALTVIFLTATALCVLLYTFIPSEALLSGLIACATTSYHLCMRLLVGETVHRIFHNRMDVKRPWFQPRPWEEKLYKRLKVKRWKGKLPTYDTAAFAPQKHTWHEIAQAMCQSEVVHSINALLSFLPIFTIPWLGAWPVFVATSLLSAMFDSLFIILQRYNRPRILRLINK